VVFQKRPQKMHSKHLRIAMLRREVVRLLDRFLRLDGEFVPTNCHFSSPRAQRSRDPSSFQKRAGGNNPPPACFYANHPRLSESTDPSTPRDKALRSGFRLWAPALPPSGIAHARKRLNLPGSWFRRPL